MGLQEKFKSNAFVASDSSDLWTLAVPPAPGGDFLASGPHKLHFTVCHTMGFLSMNSLTVLFLLRIFYFSVLGMFRGYGMMWAKPLNSFTPSASSLLCLWLRCLLSLRCLLHFSHFACLPRLSCRRHHSL